MINILLTIILLPFAAVAAFFTICFAIGLIGLGLENIFGKRGGKHGTKH